MTYHSSHESLIKQSEVPAYVPNAKDGVNDPTESQLYSLKSNLTGTFALRGLSLDSVLDYIESALSQGQAWKNSGDTQTFYVSIENSNEGQEEFATPEGDQFGLL